MAGKKRCTKCQQVFDLSDFYKDKKSKDGLCHWCRHCMYTAHLKWAKNNPKKVKQYRADWYKIHPEEVKASNTRWQKDNPEKVKDTHRKYYYNHKDVIDKRASEWQKNNPERVNTKNKKWKKNNLEKYKQIQKNFVAKGMNKIIRNLRTRLCSAIKNGQKKGKTLDYLGCTLQEFKIHLESKFQDGMTWQNYGNKKDSWSIDHILPCAMFDHSDEEQIKKCWHYTNMQPLWHIDNMKKGCKV